jgi:hypothetical protein
MDIESSVHSFYGIKSRRSLWRMLHEDNGYWPINVNPSSKRPIGVKWNKDLNGKTFINTAYNMCSVGIVAKLGMFCIDIDVTDETLSDIILEYFIDKYGKDTFLIRYGNKPKFAMIFQTTDIVVASSVGEEANVRSFYICDSKEHEFKVEHPLQVVAFGIHPTTNKLYEWVNNRSPLNIKLRTLPVINLKDWELIKDDIGKLVADQGFKIKESVGRIQSLIKGTKDIIMDTTDNTIINTVRSHEQDYTHRTVEEIRTLLEKLSVMGHVRPQSSYPEWMLVVYAVAQWAYDSNQIEEGSELLHEYSKKAPELYNSRDVEKQYRVVVKRCGKEGKKITLASLYNLLNIDTYNTLRNKIKVCRDEMDYVDLMGDVARAKLKDWEFDAIITAIHKSTNLFSLAQIRKYCKKRVDPAIFAHWCKVASDDLVYHPVLARDGINRAAFNDMYCNYADNALRLALSSGYIQNYSYVSHIAYGESDNRNTVNMWDMDTAPMDIPEKWVARLIEKFVYTVYGRNADAELFLDLCTAVARNRGVRLGLLIMLVGEVQGTGKSMTAALIKNIVGLKNTFETNARNALVSNFDHFGKNAVIVVMNDPSLDNYDKFNDFIKTHVTEPYVPSERKFKDPEVIHNNRTFIITSNKVKQIQYSANERRMLVFSPILKTKTQIELARPLFDGMAVLLNGDYSDAIYSYFLHRIPTTEINVSSGKPYVTKAAKSILTEALSPLQAFISYKIANGYYNHEQLSLNEIIRDAKLERIAYKHKFIDSDLMELGFTEKEIIRDEYGSNDVLYRLTDYIFN